MLTRVQNILLQINTKYNFLNRIINKCLETINCLKIIRAIKTNDGKKYVVVGVTRKSFKFKKLLEKHNKLWGITCISTQNKEGIIKCKDYTELLYEDVTDFVFLLFEDRYTIKTKGILLELGVTDSQIVTMNYVSNGGKLFEAYDLNLGLSWPTSDGGFVIFEDKTSNNNIGREVLSIVTLGGSTTDPYNGNIKSWPELLWEKLNKMGIPCRVINGGVCSYTVTQEWVKLYRDVLTLKPDLVISYSGVNDFLQEGYYEDGHYFALKYMVKNIVTALNNKQIRNDMQIGNVISECALGLECEGDVSDHWIKCQRLMKCVCSEFNIKYIGFLQPYNENDVNVNADMKKKYDKAISLVKELNENWLTDMTSVFDGKKDLFWDRCHVYEKGNELISQTILKEVIATCNSINNA